MLEDCAEKMVPQPEGADETQFKVPEDVATRVMITDKLVQSTMAKEAAYNPIGRSTSAGTTTGSRRRRAPARPAWKPCRRDESAAASSRPRHVLPSP